MSIPVLRPSQRADLRAAAHALSPVVMIGDAGLSDAVVAEIDRALTAHELIKIRVLGDDRSARLTLLETICTKLVAAPVQQIGKLLIIFRPKPQPAPEPKVKPLGKARGAKRMGGLASKTGHALKRNPVSGRLMAERAPRKASKADAASPPRTARVRKAGQKSAKKPFQAR